MKNFNTLLTLSELKEHYGNPPVGICPIYYGKLDKTIVESKTGNPIVLPPYKAIPSLNISFSPQQAGTGDPSPENIRPISGWDSVNVTNSNESESHDYNITFPETIYGGTVDAVTGVGEIQIAFMVFNGVEGWVLTGTTSDTYQGFALSLPYTNVTYRMFCSHFMYNSNENVANTCNQQGMGNFNIRFVISTEIVPNKTVDEWKSYLAAQAAAGTPVQVAYKLATPEPFKVNSISIPSLNGINTIYSDADNLSCDFIISSFWSDAD